MASHTFVVANYRFWVSTVPGLTALMRLDSVPDDQGRVDLSWLYFYRPGSPITLKQGIVNFFNSNPNGAYLAWFGSDETFDRIHHILQTEKPVWVSFVYQEVDTDGYQPITSLILGTDAEPVGEGFLDADAVIRRFPMLRGATGNRRSRATAPK